MALLLQLRTRTKKNTFTNPSLLHFFSTSNSNDDESESTATSSDHTPSTNSNSSYSTYFRDVKKALKQDQSTSSFFTPRNPSNSSFFTASGSAAPTPSKAATLDEIRNNLTQFRRRVSDADSTPPSSPSSNQISLQEIYRRQMAGKSGESMPIADLRPGKIGGRLSFDAIRESVRNRRQNVEPSGSDRKDGGLSSFSAFSHSLRKKSLDSTGSRTPSTIIGGTALPASVFGKELREKERGEMSDETKMEFVKIYKHDELGEKLRKLRPRAKGSDWFSLRELNDRLVKLREMDEKENEQSTSNIFALKDLRDVMIKLKASENQERKITLQRLDIMGELGRTPSFMLQPPKEHLVEKYFHPDNMSSAEKLKMELARIRDEFKMSESDCGSFRVQVAQLTTKIKHLSSVLHKKDKHSRKGLIAMVQKRKRLLKYLRRTDWDSYCFAISQLGLRDNPDTKY